MLAIANYKPPFLIPFSIKHLDMFNSCKPTPAEIERAESQAYETRVIILFAGLIVSLLVAAALFGRAATANPEDL